MDLRPTFLLLAAICMSQAAGDYASAKPRAQYGIVKLQADSNILRMRDFLMSLEVNSTLREIGADILKHLATLQVPAENLSSLQVDMTSATSATLVDLLGANSAADAVVELMNVVNQDVVSHPERLQGDFDLLEKRLVTLTQRHDLARQSTAEHVAAMEARIELELVDKTGPEVQLVRDLMTQGATLMTSQQDVCDAAKRTTDESAEEAKEGLRALILQI